MSGSTFEGKHPFLTSDRSIDYLRRVAVRTQKLSGGLCFYASIYSLFWLPLENWL
jgi:hypothetical protein